jgi:hypothetical protein
MGASKVIFASGVFVIIGMYSLSFRTADNVNATVALAQAYYTQADQIALAGAKFADVDLGGNAAAPLIPATTVSLMGGSVTYKTERPAGYSATQMKLTTIGSFSAYDVVQSKTITYNVTYYGTMEYVWPHWSVDRIYLAPNATEFSKLTPKI